MSAELIQRLRVFEIDHEPEGWPAIRMSQISELCDHADTLTELLRQARASMGRFNPDWPLQSEIDKYLEVK